MKSIKHSAAGVPANPYRNGAYLILSPCLNTPAAFSFTAMATGFNRLGSAAYISTPAIVQQAKKDWRFYENAIKSSEENTGKLYAEYKDGGVWKEHYKTWEDACVPLDISRRQIDRKISEFRSLCPNTTPSQDKQNTLKTISQLPPKPEPPQPGTADDWEKERWVDPPRVKTAPESGNRIDMRSWATKVIALFDDMPKSQIHNKLPDSAAIKIFENCVTTLYSALKQLAALEPCKCGCGFTAAICETLFRAGVPSQGLTSGQAGMIMGKLKANEWKLPAAFAFLKNEGEWVERKFKGKPARK